tara:strand:+ start:2075 stop:2269 length:195 start_codon:yes stop_codon:yes gene_type:complete
LVTRFPPPSSPPRDARAFVVARAREKDDDLSANRIGAIVLVIVDAFVVATPCMVENREIERVRA